MGPHVHTLLTILNKQLGLSHGKSVKLLSTLFPELRLARATSVRSTLRMAQRCAAAHEQLRIDLRGASEVAPDETGYYVEVKKCRVVEMYEKLFYAECGKDTGHFFKPLVAVWAKVVVIGRSNKATSGRLKAGHFENGKARPSSSQHEVLGGINGPTAQDGDLRTDIIVTRRRLFASADR